MAAKKRGLGRGLDALLGGEDGAGPRVQGPAEGELRTLPIDQINPGRYQPRQHWDEEALEELASSIRAQGLIQPVVVRAVARGKYELIAGERRWRAAQLAGLDTLPALVRVVPEQSVLAMALIENIQRQELTALEEAHALKRLIDEFELTHAKAAEAVGRSRAAVSNLLRLLDMPEAIRDLLDAGHLEMGHARALLTLEPELAVPLARQAARLGWSVRELEQAARRAMDGEGKKQSRTAAAAPRDPDIERLENELAEKFATRVQLAHGRGGKGKLVIHYHSLDELDGILGKMR